VIRLSIGTLLTICYTNAVQEDTPASIRSHWIKDQDLNAAQCIRSSKGFQPPYKVAGLFQASFAFQVTIMNQTLSFRNFIRCVLRLCYLDALTFGIYVLVRYSTAPIKPPDCYIITHSILNASSCCLPYLSVF